MRKYFCLINIILIFLLFSCKKAEVDAFDRDQDFLKDVRVEGAAKVEIDRETATIAITLPDTYTKDFVYLNLNLYDDAALVLYPQDQLNSPERVGFYYKGSPPFDFTILRDDKLGSVAKSYKVFVEHQGPLRALLTSEVFLEPISAEPYSNLYTSVRFESGVGTIPEKPGSVKRVVPKLMDFQSTISGTHDEGIKRLVFLNVNAPSLTSAYSLELAYGEKKFTLPARQKLKRMPVLANSDNFDRKFLPLPKDKEILLGGGYFLSGEPYRIQLKNALQAPIWLDLKYNNPSQLSFQIPAIVKDGVYLVNLYEKDSLLNSGIYTITDDSNKKAITQMWTESVKCPFGLALMPIGSIQRGQSLYINPFPLILGNYLDGFNENKALPNLKLKGDKNTVTIKARTRADMCYGNYSIPMYYGEYEIPSDMAPGAYEARLVYPDNVESLSYWDFIKVN